MMSQSQLAHTIQVPQNQIRIAFWPPAGHTRVLQTAGLNGCTAVGIISPTAGILAHIAPILNVQSLLAAGHSTTNDPGRVNLSMLLQVVISTYNQYRTHFSSGRSFILLAMHGGDLALPEHRAITNAVLQRLQLPIVITYYNTIALGVPRPEGVTQVDIVSDGGGGMPVVYVNGQVIQV